MRWTPGLDSDIIDRRGAGGGFGFGRGPTIGCGGAIILLVLSLLTGRNFFSLFDGSGGGVQSGPGAEADVPPANQSPEEAKAYEFAKSLITDTQNVWTQIFEQNGTQYQRAKLVAYRDMTPTACGHGQAASGPFYCPGDGNIYLDLSFNEELSRRFGASGDFAVAYVVAHEAGHHVQNLLGVMNQVPRNSNEASIRVELQADCFAGIWAHSTAKRNMLEEGDVEEAIKAASAVGDDNIQEMSGRAVNPDSFTHGSSQQRIEWFTRGFRSGQLRDCDTFR